MDTFNDADDSQKVKPERRCPTSQVTDGMPSARIKGAAHKPPVFQVHRPDTTLFTSLDGLSKQTGERIDRIRRLMLKELVDNALDEADAVSRPGQATVGKNGDDVYVVSDQGEGIAGSPDDLAALFTVHRPMISTKYLRRPERGALGTGLRIVVGSVVAAGGSIEIVTRGKRLLLRPRRVGPTEIVNVTDTPAAIGTTLTITLGPAIPYDSLICRGLRLRSTSLGVPKASPTPGRPRRFGSTPMRSSKP